MATPFSPPLYEQRYMFIVDYVKSHRPRKVVDLGCSECRLLKKLKFHRHGIQHLVGVDLDGALLTRRKRSLAPLLSDYLQPAQEPLTIELYQGSVTQRDPRTRGFHLATCVELVEHLELPEVERFAEVLFGFMAPGAVILTTPNAEFNPLLPGLRGFRHHDHKFEWSRAEFQAWSQGVCWRFGYWVEFSGVGVAAPPSSGVGFCTQIAVFHKNLNQPQRSLSEHLEPSAYNLLYRVTYPSLSENNIYQKVLIGEVLFQAQNLRQDWLRTENTDPNNNLPEASGGQQRVYQQGGAVCVPLARVWSCPRVRALCASEHRLRQDLLRDSRVKLSEDGALMILPARDEGDDDDDEEEEEKEGFEVTSCKVEAEEEDWDEELRR